MKLYKVGKHLVSLDQITRISPYLAGVDGHNVIIHFVGGGSLTAHRSDLDCLIREHTAPDCTTETRSGYESRGSRA